MPSWASAAADAGPGGPPGRWPRAARGLPGTRQDAGRALVRAGARAGVHPRAVHARTCCRPTSPAPTSTTSGTGEFVFRPRAGLHRPAARRRDQPDAAEDPVRAAGGDAGAAGHGRGARPTCCRRPVPRAGHRQPGRVRGHLPAAGGPARPLPAAGRLRLPDGRRGVRRRCAAGSTVARGGSTRPGRPTRAGLLALQAAVETRGRWTERGALLRGLVAATRSHPRRPHRRLAARIAGPGADRARPGSHPGPRLRRPRGREGGRRRRPRRTGSRSSRTSG